MLPTNLSLLSDRPINPSRRFQPIEVKESMYTMLMTLHVREVRPIDLGNYSCVARNSMGSVKGTVALESESLQIYELSAHETNIDTNIT